MTAGWRSRAWWATAGIGTALAIAPAVGQAADLPAPSAAAPPTYVAPVPDWIVTIGGELRIGPKWAGAPEDKFRLTGGPVFSIRKAGTPPEFFGPRDSFGFSILDLGQLKIGPAAQIIWRRQASSDPALNGLGDVDFALQAGAFAEYWPIQWLRLRGEVRQGFGGEKGVTGDLFMDAVVPAGQFRFSGGPRQSANSTVAGLPALPVYNASGGLYSYGAGGQVEYFLNPQWATYGYVEYERLTGSAADSPLVIQRGSPNQFTFALGARYSFTMHPLW